MAGQVDADGRGAARGAQVPQRPVARAAPCTGTSCGSTRRCGTAWPRRRAASLASVGIDSWGVDYGLLDARARCSATRCTTATRAPTGCRPGSRGAAGRRAVRGHRHPAAAVQHDLPARRDAHAPRTRRALLLIPDLLAYWLTGELGAEVTNASTTSLFDVRAQEWATEVMGKAGLPPGSSRRCAARRGHRSGDRAERAGFPAPGYRGRLARHGVGGRGRARRGPGFAYISSGTWSLAGVELAAPVLTEASRAANFTNETGIDGTIRFLRNVMGLWLLQECRRWPGSSLDELLARRRAAPAAVRDRPGRPGVPAARRHARPDRLVAGRPRRGGAPGPPRPSAASLTAWPWPTGARSAGPSLSGRHAA